MSVRIVKSNIVLVSLLLFIFAFRLVLVLSYHGYLAGDGAAYLLSRNYVLGHEPTGADWLRPPLAPGVNRQGL